MTDIRHLTNPYRPPGDDAPGPRRRHLLGPLVLAAGFLGAPDPAAAGVDFTDGTALLEWANSGDLDDIVPAACGQSDPPKCNYVSVRDDRAWLLDAIGAGIRVGSDGRFERVEERVADVRRLFVWAGAPQRSGSGTPTVRDGTRPADGTAREDGDGDGETALLETVPPDAEGPAPALERREGTEATAALSPPEA